MIRGNVMIVIGRDKVSEVLVKGVEPAAVCDSGETVVFETRDCYDDGVVSEERPLGDKERPLENPATGPLYVRGALAGDVLKVLDTVEEKPDLIVLDPPRDGIHPKALKKIIAYGVERMVYISCKPTSLARDLEVFLASGYVVKRVTCVDLFSGTGHVETVVLLSKGEIDSQKVRVEFSLEDMDMSGFQKGATYGEIKAYVLEKFGLKVSSLYISQVKRKCGLEVGENYNLAKSENARVPTCPPEKDRAIIAALEHFQMLEGGNHQ